MRKNYPIYVTKLNYNSWLQLCELSPNECFRIRATRFFCLQLDRNKILFTTTKLVYFLPICKVECITCFTILANLYLNTLLTPSHL